MAAEVLVARRRRRAWWQCCRRGGNGGEEEEGLVASAARRRARPFYFKELETKRFADLDGKSKAVFTRADNSMAHKALRRWWPRRRGRGGVTVVEGEKWAYRPCWKSWEWKRAR